MTRFGIRLPYPVFGHLGKDAQFAIVVRLNDIREFTPAFTGFLGEDGIENVLSLGCGKDCKGCSLLLFDLLKGPPKVVAWTKWNIGVVWHVTCVVFP
mmetsp:Transcript_2196/g.3175  ORF Transcript_2196/g.3175 Transcript_2196/m.3175 type:complete len:97 (+) Transcript_2196:363-653(+)